MRVGMHEMHALRVCCFFLAMTALFEIEIYHYGRVATFCSTPFSYEQVQQSIREKLCVLPYFGFCGKSAIFPGGFQG